MNRDDEVARHNRVYWNQNVDSGCEHTRPWLDLDPALIQSFAQGDIDILPEPYRYRYPQQVFRDVKGKDVLCLASGGGQQSAAFGLLGANVTVYEFIEKQLEQDRRAARHHGYPIKLWDSSMRKESHISFSTPGVWRSVVRRTILLMVTAAAACWLGASCSETDPPRPAELHSTRFSRLPSYGIGRDLAQWDRWTGDDT